MTERLLQFIWQFQYFNKAEIKTTAGEDIQVLFPGQYNTNQGPDFLMQKLKLEATTWAGTIELHIKTSDWKNIIISMTKIITMSSCMWYGKMMEQIMMCLL